MESKNKKENNMNWKQQIESKKGRFFTVTFRRKNDKIIGGTVVAEAGEVRTMLCRCGVKKFVVNNKIIKNLKNEPVRNVSREKEDNKHNVLTVFDVHNFHKLKRQGIPDLQAGSKSYRRINLKGIISLS